MFETMQAPLTFGLIAAFVTSIGLIAVAMRGDWSERYAGLFALAAGGMLVTLTLLHIVPEAFEMTPRAPMFILAGFLGGMALNLVVKLLFPEKNVAEGQFRKVDAFTPIIAIAIHSFIDGVIYAVTFAASFSSGVFAALALILHEFPEGVIAFAILRRYGFSNRNAFIFAFLAAAATTPLGVVASYPFMEGVGEEMIGVLFAMSAGLLLYVATGPLMGSVNQVPPGRSLASIGAGVAVALMLNQLPIHDHSHGHDHEVLDGFALAPEPRPLDDDAHAGHDHSEPDNHEDHDHPPPFH